MKKLTLKLSSLLLLATVLYSCESDDDTTAGGTADTGTDIATVIDVDSSLFITSTVTSIVTTPCTLSDGTVTDCYEITTTSLADDHNMGPWCPDNINDDASQGGIWLEGGEVYDVDGAFIQNLATFYNDNTWNMYDANGDIQKTETLQECEEAANPNVGAQYENYCVECLPSYVANLTQTYLIPITPVKTTTATQFGMGGGGPGGPGGGISQRGLAFNGVVFDAPAPTNAILSAYTLAPFDDAGGHINLTAGYHYHAATGLTTQIAQNDGHSAMIGYAMDGHGLYERLDSNGVEPNDLDECRGHYDEIRGYHYHVAAPGTNSFIDCLYGATVN